MLGWVLNLYSQKGDINRFGASLMLIGGRVNSQACADGERGPTSAWAEIWSLQLVNFIHAVWIVRISLIKAISHFCWGQSQSGPRFSNFCLSEVRATNGAPQVCHNFWSEQSAGNQGSKLRKAIILGIIFKAALRSRGAFFMSRFSPSLPPSWHFSSPVIGRHGSVWL